MNGMGDVLETVRRANGMTQQELCEHARITQAALSRYENDLRVPDEAVLHRLADALGVSTLFLHRARRAHGALAVDVHMRRQRTAKPSAWRYLEARLNAYRMHASAIFEEVSIRAEQSVPTFDPIDVSPGQAAAMLRAQWRMPIGPARHLTRWMEAAGCLVFTEDFGTRRIDGLSQWVGDHPIILLNSMIPPDRARFTLAHELGHLLLHNGLASEDPETEANSFASEFLMPAHVIRPDLRPLTLGHLLDLKRLWGVSMQALLERAHQLGLATAADRVRLHKAMNARGWKANEPGADEVAPETPELVMSISSMLQRRGLSEREIAEIAGFAAGNPNNPFLPTQRRLAAV